MFGALLRLCGLSGGAAAYFLGAPRKDVIAWAQEAAAPPQEHFNRLYALYEAQENEAERIIASWEDAGRPAQLHYRVAADDTEAREAGWPSVGAQMVGVAIAQATLTEVAIAFVTGE